MLHYSNPKIKNEPSLSGSSKQRVWGIFWKKVWPSKLNLLRTLWSHVLKREREGGRERREGDRERKTERKKKGRTWECSLQV
jgi:hypothetical protein